MDTSKIEIHQNVTHVGEVTVSSARFVGKLAIANQNFDLTVAPVVSEIAAGQTFICLNMQDNRDAIAAFGGGFNLGGRIDVGSYGTLCQQSFDTYILRF